MRLGSGKLLTVTTARFDWTGSAMGELRGWLGEREYNWVPEFRGSGVRVRGVPGFGGWVRCLGSVPGFGSRILVLMSVLPRRTCRALEPRNWNPGTPEPAFQKLKFIPTFML